MPVTHRCVFVTIDWHRESQIQLKKLQKLVLRAVTLKPKQICHLKVIAMPLTSQLICREDLFRSRFIFYPVRYQKGEIKADENHF